MRNPLICVLVLLTACGKKEDTSALFTKMDSEATGIGFVNLNEETDAENILTYEYFYNGGGVAAGDINNDGLTDLFFTSNQGDNKLYLNKGDFHFEDISAKAGITGKSGWKTGAAMVDINGDGFLDIYVCRSGNLHEMLRHNSLYINNGNLTFTDQGPAFDLDDASYSTQSAFLDFDNDGDLDIFLLNHSRLQISNSFDISRRFRTDRVPFVGNRLYMNDKGRFRDVSDSIGIYGPASNYGLGIAVADLNNDGWQDLYTSNDYTEKDKLLLNRVGKFHDIGDSVLSQMSQFSMGTDIADLNNDGLLDIITVDMLPETNQRQKEFFWPDRYDMFQAMVKNGRHFQYMRNMLHLNNGDGTFSEIGMLAGIAQTDWSWAPLIVDFDNDGLQDIFISNGFKRNFTSNDFLKYKADLSLKAAQGQPIESMGAILRKMPSNATHDYLFLNQNGFQFEDNSAKAGFGNPTLSNGAAYADLDNDGDADLIVNRMDEEAGIYRNNAEKKGNAFIKIKLAGSTANKFGIGARVTVYNRGGQMTRTMNPYRGFQSSVEPVLIFGLGKTGAADSVIVEWPGGTMQRLVVIKSGQTLTVKQSDAISPGAAPMKSKNLIVDVTQLPARHTENEFVDFKVQSQLPRMYSTTGPALAVSSEDKSGRQYIYVGGAKGFAGRLMVSDLKGVRGTGTDFSSDKHNEDVDAEFFDMDNDGDADLYVVSGGYEYESADRDRLYRNDGKGTFVKMILPDVKRSGSCVRPADIDSDGDLDLFVGARLVPGRYPEPPESMLLENDGKGNYSINNKWMQSVDLRKGMITDAAWLDINKDNKPDLVVTGEFMPVTVFVNDNGALVDKTTQYFKEPSRGWWNCIHVADMDDDGDADLLAGNYGLNNQYKPTVQQPVRLIYGDYDSNGSVDLLLNYFIGSESYPSPTRDEMVEQVPVFKKKFPDYATYTTATAETILTPEQLKGAGQLVAEVFESSYFRFEAGSFTRVALPLQAQFAPIFAIGHADVDHDGILDIVAGGNLSAMGVRFGKASGSYSMILKGDGKGAFAFLPPNITGNTVRGDIRKIVPFRNGFLCGLNNGPVTLLSFRNDLEKGKKKQNLP
jgi:enediyne biosynthesis protein E4